MLWVVICAEREILHGNIHPVNFLELVMTLTFVMITKPVMRPKTLFKNQ